MGYTMGARAPSRWFKRDTPRERVPHHGNLRGIHHGMGHEIPLGICNPWRTPWRTLWGNPLGATKGAYVRHTMRIYAPRNMARDKRWYTAYEHFPHGRDMGNTMERAMGYTT